MSSPDIQPKPLQLGDRASVFETAAKKRVWFEIIGVWLGTLLLIRLVVFLADVVPALGIPNLFTIDEVLSGVCSPRV